MTDLSQKKRQLEGKMGPIPAGEAENWEKKTEESICKPVRRK